MDNFRDSYFNITWDLTKKYLRGTFGSRECWGKQYDTGRGFAVTIVEGDQVTVPSTETVRLKWEKPDRTEGYVTAVVVDNKFLIENIDQMFTVPGSIRADLEIWRGGKIISSATFYVSVEKALAVDAIESSSEFTALQEALAAVDDVQGQVDAVIANATVDSEVILARGANHTLGARLDASDAQLAETGQRIDNIITTPVPTGEIIAQEIIDARQGSLSLGTNLAVIKEKIKDITINVKDFGAKGDGITDDKLAFQSAVDYSSSIGGATIFMPTGTYMIKGNIRWKSNVSLKGAGIGKSIFVVDGKFDGVIVDLSQPSHGTGTNFLENCCFEDFEIDGSGYTFTDADIRGKGLFILYMRRARFRNLYLHDTVGTALGCDFLTETVIDSVVVERAGRLFSSTNTGGQSGIGIGTNALENETVIVSNCHTIDCGNYGIFIESQNGERARSKHARIVNCFSQGNRIGIGNKGAGGCLISGCSSINNTQYGISLNEHSSEDQIIGCKISGNTLSGIQIDGSSGLLSILGNHIHDNGWMGIRFLNNLGGYTRKNILISQNKIFNNGYNGISSDGELHESIINNNEIYNNGKTGGTNNNVGILFSGIHSKINVIGNLIYDNQATKTQVAGIKFPSTTAVSDNFVITNNNLAGYTENTGIYLGTGPRNNFVMSNNGGAEKLKEISGQTTILDGTTFVTINHPLGVKPVVVATTSGSFGSIRVDSESTLSFVIRRPLAENTGNLVVNWYAKVN